VPAARHDADAKRAALGLHHLGDAENEQHNHQNPHDEITEYHPGYEHDEGAKPVAEAIEHQERREKTHGC
jgi:hypothetical protein